MKSTGLGKVLTDDEWTSYRRDVYEYLFYTDRKWAFDGPDDDVDIGQEVLFKGQCSSWTEMKYTWLELNGKVEDYFRKPWKKHLGLYEA